MFRDEKGCCITQEIGGVQIAEWVKVLLGATLEVLRVVGRLRILTLLVCSLSTGCHQGILPCSSPLKMFASVNWLALELHDSTLCFVIVTLSWEGLMN